MGKMLRWFQQAPLLVRIGFLVGLGLPGLFLLLAYLGLQIVQSSTEDIVQHRMVIAQMMATHVDEELRAQTRALQLTSAALAPALASRDLDGARRSLHGLRDALGERSVGTALLDAAGSPLLVEPAPNAPVDAVEPDADAVREALRTGVPVASAARRWAGRPVVTLAAPIRAPDGARLGVAATMTDASRLNVTEFARDVRRLGLTGHAELIDQRGVVIAASEPERLLGPAEHPEFYRPLLARHETAVGTTAGADDERAGWRDQPHAMVFVPIETAPWGLTLGATEAETLAPVRRMERGFLVLVVIGLLVNLLLLALTASKVVTPLHALIHTAERIARGDLDVAVPPVGVAEVRALADAFERMRRKLWASQRELAVGKSRYEGVFRAITDPVFTVDTSLRVTSLNPAAERFLGWKAEEALGRRCTDLVQCADERGRAVCTLVCPFLVKPRLDVPLVGAFELLETATGRRVTVAVTRSPICDEAGRVVGMLHVLRDVSAEIEANRLKDQFIASVSHELRTPLGYIKGFTTTLLRKDTRWDPRKARRFLEMIDGASDRLAEQIDNLLDMSRINAGALAIERQPVDIPALARGVVERLQPRADGHRFELRLPPDLPPAAGDARRIEQVLLNLLDNALKYSPDGGEIVVEASAAGRELRIRVGDEGIGVPPDELEAIFGRFYRSEDPVARRIGGSGLGLAISRGIVEAHGGAVWAECRPGRGSVFTFTLPVWIADAASAAPSAGRVGAGRPRAGPRCGSGRVSGGSPVSGPRSRSRGTGTDDEG